jgi:hypothetical protein
MRKWIPVTFKTMSPIHATDSLVSSGIDVTALIPFGAQTETSSSNVAKFICTQIARFWISHRARLQIRVTREKREQG